MRVTVLLDSTTDVSKWRQIMLAFDIVSIPRHVKYYADERMPYAD